MLSYDERKVQKLFYKAQTCIGMMAEVKAKCLLMKSRIAASKEAGDDPEDLERENEIFYEQMEKDVAKYSRKFDEACEELKRYGIFEELE